MRILMEKFVDEFYNIIYNLDEPFGGGLPSWYFFSKIFQKKYKVVVSGVGGDELFEIIIDHLIFKRNKEY